ncbi:hypothetical protein GOODEAATRI_005414 [Goodea atripinnis]|uniref:Uncharacterized protein n=1 Tax=Goodea atripinnis TaxID=208336 RepID=A0ABV0NHR2_9TELE
MNPPHITEERAVFTQLKPVRMSGAEGAEDTSVFEDVKPPVRISDDPLNSRLGLPGFLLPSSNVVRSYTQYLMQALPLLEYKLVKLQYLLNYLCLSGYRRSNSTVSRARISAILPETRESTRYANRMRRSQLMRRSPHELNSHNKPLSLAARILSS